jgi:hypothetical protein
MVHALVRILLIGLQLAIAAGTLAGCAIATPSPAAVAMTVRPGDSTPPPATQARPAFAVASEVTVSPALGSRVSAGDLRRALEGSLEVAGLLARERARYLVEAHLEQLEVVEPGPQRAVLARVRYVVRLAEDGSTATEETLVSRFPGLPGTWGVTEDKVAGPVAPRQADEGAVRNNLAAAVRQLVLFDTLRAKRTRR